MTQLAQVAKADKIPMDAQLGERCQKSWMLCGWQLPWMREGLSQAEDDLLCKLCETGFAAFDRRLWLHAVADAVCPAQAKLASSALTRQLPKLTSC